MYVSDERQHLGIDRLHNNFIAQYVAGRVTA